MTATNPFGNAWHDGKILAPDQTRRIPKRTLPVSKNARQTEPAETVAYRRHRAIILPGFAIITTNFAIGSLFPANADASGTLPERTE